MNVSKPWGLYSDLCDIAAVSGFIDHNNGVLHCDLRNFKTPHKIFLFIARQLGEEYEVEYFEREKQLQISSPKN